MFSVEVSGFEICEAYAHAAAIELADIVTRQVTQGAVVTVRNHAFGCLRTKGPCENPATCICPIISEVAA